MLKKRFIRTAIAAAAVATVGLSSAPAFAGGDYPPTTDTVPERTLDVSAFTPVCINDTPYIQYAVVPIGFDSVGPATLTIRDIDGNIVTTIVVDSLSGTILYPGAAVDSDGNAIDWPGWALVDGVYVPDSSDAILREGLTIEVEVNPTANATVSYPPATSACAGPEDSSDPEDPSDPDDPETSGVLPSTGSNATLIILLLGTGLLGAGIVTSVAMRRRHADLDPS